MSACLEETCFMTCTASQGLAQHVHPYSLVKIFSVHEDYVDPRFSIENVLRNWPCGCSVTSLGGEPGLRESYFDCRLFWIFTVYLNRFSNACNSHLFDQVPQDYQCCRALQDQWYNRDQRAGWGRENGIPAPQPPENTQSRREDRYGGIVVYALNPCPAELG